MAWLNLTPRFTKTEYPVLVSVHKRIRPVRYLILAGLCTKTCKEQVITTRASEGIGVLRERLEDSLINIIAIPTPIHHDHWTSRRRITGRELSAGNPSIAPSPSRIWFWFPAVAPRACWVFPPCLFIVTFQGSVLPADPDTPASAPQST
ncbi:hypothetical protein CBS147346_10785 [Aspergillus niger]|nr:hypothetical protein CBS147346_10785 [Aspergillus niger]